MDYSRIYTELMERANDRALEGYSERHHIVPKCMGGDNKPRNIAILTPEEHYLAHQLLVKIYPDNHKLVFAANMMCGGGPKGNNQRVNNKQFGWLKRKASQSQKSRTHTLETIIKISKVRTGKTFSKEVKEKMSKNCSNKKSVQQFDKLGTLLNKFSSAVEAQLITGIHQTNICKCCSGKLKSSGGFIWKFS